MKKKDTQKEGSKERKKIKEKEMDRKRKEEKEKNIFVILHRRTIRFSAGAGIQFIFAFDSFRIKDRLEVFK